MHTKFSSNNSRFYLFIESRHPTRLKACLMLSSISLTLCHVLVICGLFIFLQTYRNDLHHPSALCVNNAFTYIKIVDKTRQNKIFILLEKRLCQLFPEVSKADCTEERKAELYDVVERMTGDKLVGLQYTPLFGYFKEYTSRAFKVICDNYVTEEGGTGIVHQAPAFGEDDYRVCLLHGIVSKGEDLPCPVDANGRFTKDVPEFKGSSRHPLIDHQSHLTITCVCH
jgi:tRNA synthetases class I (I, L, M and V)